MLCEELLALSYVGVVLKKFVARWLIFSPKYLIIIIIIIF